MGVRDLLCIAGRNVSSPLLYLPLDVEWLKLAVLLDGVIGFMRSIAGKYMNDNIRVNAICPGTVATGLLEAEAWKTFPQEYFTPISVIVGTVLKLIDGDNMADAKGVQASAGDVYGKAVEINVNNFYFREQPEYCDEAMATVMESTKRDNIKPTTSKV